jgi:hypothetical protein
VLQLYFCALANFSTYVKKPITTSSYELCPGFIAMVQEQAFLGLDYENLYHHLFFVLGQKLAVGRAA